MIRSPARTSFADERYARAAIFLHWTIAALIVVQVCLGWYMNEALPHRSPAHNQIVGLHVSVGLTILLLVLVRIGVRLTHRPPPFPAAMPPWERLLAWATQAVFYLLMLVLPLTGWAIVSAHAGAKISFWGLPWPAMPGIQGLLGGAGQKDARESLAHLHVFVLIWILVVSLALHVAGALWHQFRAPPVLWRMGVGRRSPRLS